ncbi:TonB-dependent receptor [Novosphingobium sp. Gsoil 351]|uniref:TonB-dependent receptor n=1 Tax=Novosphingobium sp. Gsoil 351 TaxID=2675225 RepID=UPI0018A82FCA|nr:TonB-dependent receptor [Novosphingobium sp. Gsoil 351]
MTHRYLNRRDERSARGRISVSSVIARLGALSVIATMTALPATALAQAAPSAAPAEGDADANEIVVTALKQRQLLSDVPATLSVLTEQRIAESRIEQVEALAATVSNVNIRQTVPGVSPVITIRGVGLDDFSTTNSPATGVSLDEVTLSSIALLNSDFFDIGRIEVLKGPQGTLYGRNTVSGALNVISAKPAPSFDAAFQAGYGNYKTFDASGMVNAPLADGLALRLSGKTIQQREGFYTSNYRKDGSLGKRDLGRRDVILGRAQLGYNPTDDLEVVAKYEIQRVRSEMGQYKGNYTFKPGSPFVKCAPYVAGMLDNAQCTDAFGFTNTNPDRFNIDIARDVPYNVDEHLLSLNAKATIGRVELASVTGYIAFDRTYRIDVDTTPREELDFIQRDKVHQFSQELRAFTKLGIADVQVGGFYSYDRAEGNNDNLISSIPLVLFGLPAQNGKTTFDQKTRSAAGFGNVIWHLTDALNLTTGARYTWERRHYIGGTSYPLCPISPVNVACSRVGVGTTFTDRTISDRNWSWKVGLDYKIGPDALVYASVSKGTKSGGFVTRFTTTNNQLLPYRPESLIAYELGAKADFNRVVTLDGAVFYYRFKDVQTNLLDGTLTVPLQRLSNINGTSELYGAEASATLRPVEGLTLQSNLGLLHTRLATFATGPVPFVGNRFSNAPNLTFDALARYETPIGSNLRLILQGDTSHQGFAFKDASNNKFIVQRAYWLFNARAAVATADKRWEFAVWGKNLSDTKYIISGGDTSGLGVIGLTTNNPRTYGASISWKY